MRHMITLAVALCALCAGALGRADTFEMKDGSLVNGRYAGGTSGTVRVETGEGVKVLQTADLLAITFTDAAAPAPAAVPPLPAAPAAPPAAAKAVTVPAGSVITIRMDSQVSSKDKQGTKFSAKLLADLMAADATVAKAGTTVYGQVERSKQAGRLAGKSQLALSLTGIDLDGKIQPILTTNFADAGKGEFRKTARNVAGGALVGHAIDDDKGAGTGAAVGAGVSLIKKGDAVTVPAGAILEFRLTQPFEATAR